jgi:hypothetical protein
LFVFFVCFNIKQQTRAFAQRSRASALLSFCFNIKQKQGLLPKGVAQAHSCRVKTQAKGKGKRKDSKGGNDKRLEHKN